MISRHVKRFLALGLALLLGLSAMPMSPTKAEGMRNVAKGLSYTYDGPGANDMWPDSEEQTELTDGVYGIRDFKDDPWVGYYKLDPPLHRTIEFDLGEKMSVGKVKTNFLKEYSAGIKFPNFVTIEASPDGVEWDQLSKTNDAKDEAEKRPMTQEFTWDGSKEGVPGHSDITIDRAYVRYIRVNFDFEGSTWVFLDEVEIWAEEGKTETAGDFPYEEEEEEEEVDESDFPGYKYAGEDTAGVNNLVLLYNQYNLQGTWQDKDNILPYVAYVDEEGKPVDWMFDGVLYLAINAPGGRKFYATQDPSNKSDWDWYLDNTFKAGGDMATLNEAMAEAAEALGEPDRKLPVFITVHNPAKTQSDFGALTEGGPSLNFNHKEVDQAVATANKKAALDWYMGELLSRFEAGNYSNLTFAGFYWMNENLEKDVPDNKEILQYISSKAHEAGKKFIWIPYFAALGADQWQEVGFDAAALQPSYMFRENEDASRLKKSALRSREYGMGVELEIAGNGIFNTDKGRETRSRYYDYMDYGLSEGYDGDVFKAYYQDGTFFRDAARSADENVRAVYDETYKFIIGEYKGRPGEAQPEPVDNLLTKDNVTLEALGEIANPDEWGRIQSEAPARLTDNKKHSGNWDASQVQINRSLHAEGPYQIIGNLGAPHEIHSFMLSTIELQEYGVYAPDDVTFAISDDGETWTDVETVVKGDPAKPGWASFYEYRSDQSDAPLKASYVRVEFNNAWNEAENKRRNWNGADEFVVEGRKLEDEPLPVENILTADMVSLGSGTVLDEAKWTPIQNSAPAILTDKQKRTGWENGTVQINKNFARGPYQFVADLGAPYEIHEITLSTIGGEDYAVGAPDEVRFYISTNGESWSNIGIIPKGDPAQPGYFYYHDYTVDRSDSPPVASYLMVTYQSASRPDGTETNWSGVEEWTVMGRRHGSAPSPTPTPEPTPTPPPAEPTPVPDIDSILTAEMISLEAAEEKKPDAWAQKQAQAPEALTDRAKRVGWNHDGTVQINKGVAVGPYDVIADLGATYTIRQMNLSAIARQGDGIGAPTEVIYSVSDDGETWTEVGRIAQGDPSQPGYFNYHDYFLDLSDAPVEAKFVKASYATSSHPNGDEASWSGIDEFAVGGELVEDPAEPTPVPTEPAEPTPVPTEPAEPTPVPDIDSILTAEMIRLEAAEEKNPDVWAQKQAQAPEALTDRAKRVGWNHDGTVQINKGVAVGPYDVIADLGATYTIRQMNLSAIARQGDGIGAPSEVIYSVSDDGETWTEVGRIAQGDPSQPGYFNYHDYFLDLSDAPVEAKFVKASYPTSTYPNGDEASWSGIDEFAVGGELVEDPPAEPTPIPTEPAEPTPVPTEPAEPTPVPTEPAEPTPVPTEPTEPTPVPTEPTEPTPVPTEPTEPTPVPTEPTEPTPVPTEPDEPTPVPTEPDEPTPVPTEPTEPSTAPTEPDDEPTEPVTEPTEPSEGPTVPSEAPTEPSEAPTEPSVVPTEPTATTEAPTASSETHMEPSAGPTDPDKPIEPAKTEPAPTNDEPGPSTGEGRDGLVLLAVLLLLGGAALATVYTRRSKDDTEA